MFRIIYAGALALALSILAWAAPAKATDANTCGYTQGQGGWYKLTDRSGPYAIDGSCTATLLGGGSGGGGGGGAISGPLGSSTTDANSLATTAGGTPPTSFSLSTTCPGATGLQGLMGCLIQALNNPQAAGSNIIGKLGIDQTTPGTTNGVQIGGTLPAFGTTPTFNLGNLNGAATAANQPTLNGDGGAPAHVTNFPANPSTVYSNQLSCSGATSTAIAAPSQALVNGVITKALKANAGTIYVGQSGITAATGYPLSAGEASSYGATNLSAIFYLCTSASDFLAVTGN